MPYDTFAVKYMAVMCAQGYHTGFDHSAHICDEIVPRAAWTHLLLQSPWGEIPTGGYVVV
jgi:hypothetical protein